MTDDNTRRLEDALADAHRQMLDRDSAYLVSEERVAQLEREKAELQQAHADLIATRAWRLIERGRRLKRLGRSAS
jgi:hypothetical protein